MTVNYEIEDNFRYKPGMLEVCGRFMYDIDTFTKAIFQSGTKGTALRSIRQDYMGNVLQKMQKYYAPDKLLWLMTQEPDGVFLYKPQKLDRELYYRGTRAYDVTGWSEVMILQNCFREDSLNSLDYKRERGWVYHDIELKAYWTIEYDGKSVMDLMGDYPKMPYEHVKMVIENEGGFIDKEGTIHRQKE